MVLIPALLLGGGLVRQGDTKTPISENKTPIGRWSKVVAGIMVALVMAGVGGELVAINGAFAVGPSATSIRIVVAVLVAGTIAIGLRTARHWVDRFISPAARYYVYVLALAIGLLAFAVGQIIVTDTIHDALAAQAQAAVQTATDSQQAARGTAALAASRTALENAERSYREACRVAPGFEACSPATAP